MVSQAVDALIVTSGKVAVNIGKAEARYRATGDALSRYASALETAQQEADCLLSDSAETVHTARFGTAVRKTGG